MAGRARRYVLGSLTGAAVVGASVTGLHLLPTAGPEAAAASLVGSAAPGCTVRSAVTSCAQPRPSSDRGNSSPGVYRDGVYDVTGHYLTPGGSESIAVSLTLDHDTVTASSVGVEATSPTARQFQVQFASRYADRVVAQDVAHLRLSRVAGASLTSIGFDDAVAQIQAAARD